MSTVALARAEAPFSERVVNLLEKADYRPAVTDEEKERIYRLRYDAYLREGAITPNFGRRLSDRFDDLDNSCIFGVYIDGELASSIRLSVLSPDYPDLPALGVFPDILGPEVEAGHTIIDPTRFVVDYNLGRFFPELPYVTTRIGWMAGEFFGADLILATVRREHQAFYKRVFGHRLVADARDYPTLVKPLSLMTLDYFGVKNRVHQRYPFFRSTYFERRMLFAGPGMPVDWSSEDIARRAASVSEATVESVPALAG